MAVTIITSPQTLTPAYNEQYFVASSTLTAQTNFRYVMNVLVGGVLTQNKFSARPDNTWVYCNPQRIVEGAIKNYWEKTFDYVGRVPADTFGIGTDTSIRKVVIGIDEEYGTTPTQYNGASATYYTWNGSYSANDYLNYTYSTGVFARTLTSIDTSNLRNTIYYGLKYHFIYWMRASSSRDLTNLNVVCYDVFGNIIQQAVISNETPTYSPAPNSGIILANCSPYGLNLIKTNHPLDIVSQTVAGDIVPSNTVFYYFYFTDGSSNPSSQSFNIYCPTQCTKYQNTALHFLNRLGGYDTFCFNLVRRKPNSKKTMDYKKLPFKTTASYDYLYSNDLADEINYSTIITNKVQLNSNWITEAQSTQLIDLFMSPDVKYEDENGNLYAVRVSDKDYEIKTKKNDHLIQIMINLEYSYEDIRQRG